MSVLSIEKGQSDKVKSAFDLLRNSQCRVTSVHLADRLPHQYGGIKSVHALAEKIETEAIYDRYVEAQRHEMEEIRKDEDLLLPQDLDYSDQTLGLSLEEIEKLSQCQPETIGAASRIPGVTQAGVLGLLRHAKKRQRQRQQQVDDGGGECCSALS